METQAGKNREHSRSGGRGPTRIALILATVIALVSMNTFAAGVANAATVYEIAGDWESGTPDTVAKGDVVTSVWRVNVNDDAEAPVNDPVENVVLTVTLTHGQFKGLPDLCLTTAGLTPPSSISDDGLILTCNLGTVNQGTAVVVQAPVVADGVTGDQITASGNINGQTADLSPIDIRNTFGMDMLWGTPTATLIRPDTGAIGFDFEWTLFADKGSDEGPDSVVYNLNISLANGDPLEPSQQAPTEPFNHPCTPFQQSGVAEGHPYSRAGAADRLAPFVDSCELVQTGATTFQLTLTGIDYSQTQVPINDSAGNPLPADQVALASGSIWLQVNNLTSSTSANLSSSAPIYTSVTGLTSEDDPSNNTSSKVVTFPGTWSHPWARPGGGTYWDNTLKLAPGALITSITGDTLAAAGVSADTPMGDCDVLDAAYTDYEAVTLWAWQPGEPAAEAPAPFGQVAYYIGLDPTVTPGSPSYNPDAFTGCGTNVGWTSVEPTDKTLVKAVRWTGTAGDLDGRNFQLRVDQRIQEDAPIGQDVWSWGAVIRNGAWTYPGRGAAASYTPTPGERYAGTNGGRDILHVVYAVPGITKRADRSIVRPGVPANYTLTYTANGSGAIPLTVDGYRIVDTLPVGMTYVEASADPAPTITTDTEGRQVLTWNLGGVPTNTRNTLTYQAVAGDSVTPGQTLTNTAVSSLRGEESRPSTAQVTTSSSGFTEISKSADNSYIPNLAGDGNGEGSWTVYMRSFDPLPQAYTDTIDILPYIGDERGTEYSGSYSVTGVDTVPGAMVYYTTDDVGTLSDDPDADSNGSAGTVTGATTNWSTTPVENPTAIRVIGPELAPSDVQQFTIHIATVGAADGDTLVNRAQGRAGHTQLVMRTSAPITVANYYAYELKKYVQDVNGDWHDAQDLTDYPVFHLDDEVNYRVVVTNVGRGTLTDIEVTDDKQPELGAFHIDSLESGQSQTHEYSITLGPDTAASLVNTACAQAAQPEDMETSIPDSCDPAGIEFVNYTTVKTADPASGTPVSVGDTIEYTITVTQQGSSPADAVFTDHLSDVLDDSAFGNDVEADIGTAEYDAATQTIAWSGTIPVGEVATITYSVTVNAVGDGNDDLVNPVTSPGCVVIDGQTPYCITDHKTKRPLNASGGRLPNTGGTVGVAPLLAGFLMVVGGLGLVILRRRRLITSTNRSSKDHDLL